MVGYGEAADSAPNIRKIQDRCTRCKEFIIYHSLD